MKLKTLLLFTLTLFVSMASSAATTIKEVGGWFESGYITWDLVEGASTYHVYCKPVDGSYTQLDAALVRNYGDYGRADVLGITAGNYQFKVVPVAEDGTEMTDQAAESSPFEVRAHDRGGFAHFNYSGVGAYKDDGTLKNNAKVLYVTSKTAKTVTCTVVTDAKGKVETFTGLQAIIDARQKGYDTTPLAIRLIGTIEEADMDSFSSSAEGLQIKGKNADSEMNITIEGVGNDAGIRGFGILIRNCKSVELRNFASMLCMDDCVSFDTDNSNCWVHNIDFFYGKAGSASDQAKGDGSLDCKTNSKYMTFSYNRFWDSGKMALCGMKSESGENFISYHHNWFDHSDSRHPRVRTMTVHVYNNYFDGIAKYGVGATKGSNVFVESNYYRNVNKPMLISLQGSDMSDGEGTFSGETGGMIKAYGNVYAEKSTKFSLKTHKESATAFDCYEAATRDEVVPDTYKTLSGGTTYNNFDTDKSKMYVYTAHAAADVPAVVTGQYGAGRMQHGDFQWTFNNAVDDASYTVNTALKSAITNYKTSLVGIFGGEPAGGGDGGDGGDDGDDGGEDPVVPPVDGDYSCYFTADKKPSNAFYTITGSYSNSKGTATVNGTTYDWCLKMESATSIKFTTEEEMTLTLVFASSGTGNIKIDGVKVNAASGNIITYKLAAGAHELTKADSCNLFYINLTGTSDPTGIEETMNNALEEGDGIIYDLSGRVVKNPQRGIYIRNGKKIIFQ